MFRLRELARREDPECRADLHPASGAGASEYGIDRIVADAVSASRLVSMVLTSTAFWTADASPTLAGVARTISPPATGST